MGQPGLTLCQAAIENLPVATAIMDADGTVAFLNKEARQSFNNDFFTTIGERIVASECSEVRFKVLYSPNYTAEPDPIEVCGNQVEGGQWIINCVTDPSELKVNAPIHAENLNLKRFISIFSHEFRNPLNSVYLALKLLEQKHHDQYPDDDNPFEMIDHHMASMRKMLNDIRETERFDAGSYTLEKQALSLKEVLMDCISTLALQESHKFQLELDEQARDEDFTVYADRQRLEQIFSNVVGNAVKYSPLGSTIHLRIASKEGTVEVEVEDEGEGIEPQELERISQAYFQGSQGIDRHQGGLGLGAFITKVLVQLHDGKISYASQGKGRGTLVRLSFPYCLDNPVSWSESHEPTRDSDWQQQQASVLIIDDNEDLANLYLNYFHDHSELSAEVAFDGLTGLKKLQSKTYDIALIDIGLPDINGYEIARKVCAEAFDQDRPTLIALTGYGLAEDKRKAAEAGFVEHLTKPVTLEELSHTIARYLPGGTPSEQGGKHE